ncbi:MAG: sporulation protein YqfD [Oscillospiraceae bacterium]|jgi:similar to stage IV sporulation protein|nr:sporulation protein YqfD [Oscillospiraceae bacterium]
MLSLKITRWCLGYVRFSVTGGSPERFFNYCARSGIILWNITSRSSSSAFVASGLYRALRPLARKAGCRLRVRERHGLPFLLRRMRTHRGIVYGAAAFAVILILLSLRVWCVDVTGNTTLDSRAVLSALAENGVSPGTRIAAVDTKRVEQKLMLMFPKIRWMTINTQGCMMQVCIQEKTEQPQIVEQNGVCNVKASATGQVTAIRVYAGTAQVNLGDAVAQGQLLVSGVVEDALGGSTFVHASAEIIAETSRSCEIRIPLRQTLREPTGTHVVRRSLQLFGADFPLTMIGKPKGNYDVSGTQTDVKLFGTLLPVSLYEEVWNGMQAKSVEISRQQAIVKAKEKLLEYEKSLPGDAKILSSDVSDRIEQEVLIYSASLKCEENIAEESEILIKS